jgi:hypothetical protein
MAMALVGLVSQSLCLHGGCLLRLLFRERHAHPSFLLMTQAGECSLALLRPGSQAFKPGMEAVAEEPQEDGACCHHPLCQGGTFDKKALVMSGLLVKSR